MDVLPLRPLPHHRPRPVSSRTAPTHTARPAHPAHAPPAEPPSADEIALIAQQTQFDMMVQARAEAEREANALRDLAMAQVKHDDQAMNAWIKLI